MASGTRPERDGWDRHLLADRGRLVTPRSLFNAQLAHLAACEETTVEACLSGLPIPPRCARRIAAARAELTGRRARRHADALSRTGRADARSGHADAADGRLRGARRVIVEVGGPR